MPVSAAVRLSLQSAVHKLQTRFRRSKPELHGPGSGLRIGPWSSRGVKSTPLVAHLPDPSTETGIEGV
eukprot:1781688-Alexandrium_andersonii.AAC.1